MQVCIYVRRPDLPDAGCACIFVPFNSIPSQMLVVRWAWNASRYYAFAKWWIYFSSMKRGALGWVMNTDSEQKTLLWTLKLERQTWSSAFIGCSTMTTYAVATGVWSTFLFMVLCNFFWYHGYIQSISVGKHNSLMCSQSISVRWFMFQMNILHIMAFCFLN